MRCQALSNSRDKLRAPTWRGGNFVSRFRKRAVILCLLRSTFHVQFNVLQKFEMLLIRCLEREGPKYVTERAEACKLVQTFISVGYPSI